MAWDQDNLMFAIAHAGLAVGPGRPVDTAAWVRAFDEHGFSLVPPEMRGPHWLEIRVDELVRAGWGWPSPERPASATFDVNAALAEMDGVGIAHVDDPTEEELLLQRVSDDALVREVLRRGLDPYEPAPGPTP